MGVEQELEELRRNMALLLERSEPAPALMRYERAARMLDISVSKLKTLIRSGTIVPVTLGGRRMVPLSEIERVATPTRTAGQSTSPAGPRRRSVPRSDVSREIDKISAAMKRR